MVTAHTPALRPAAMTVAPLRGAGSRRRHWYWLAAGLVLFFLIPFCLTDVAKLPRDVYYGIYILSALGFFGAWIVRANDSSRSVLTRNWRAGTALGVVGAGLLVAIVLGEPATDRPGGLALAAAVLWRGVLYGLADGLVLSAFPILAVFAAFAGTRVTARRSGRIAVGALALAVSLLYTAVYHVGYSDFRDEKVRKPLAGDLVWSLPTLATLSPVGAPIAHVGLHVAAVAHSYETDVFLPPHAAGVAPAPSDRVADGVTGPDRAASRAVATRPAAPASHSAAVEPAQDSGPTPGSAAPEAARPSRDSTTGATR